MIQQLSTLKEKDQEDIRNALKQNNSGLALFLACQQGATSLAYYLLAQMRRLDININEKHFDNNTILDSLESAASIYDDAQYQQLHTQLRYRGALKSIEIEKPLLLNTDEYVLTNILNDGPFLVGAAAISRDIFLCFFCAREKKALLVYLSAEDLESKKDVLCEELTLFRSECLSVIVAGGWDGDLKSMKIARLIEEIFSFKKPQRIDKSRYFKAELEQQCLCINTLVGEYYALDPTSYIRQPLIFFSEGISNNSLKKMSMNHTKFS